MCFHSAIPWGSDQRWPYRLFSFQASAAGAPPDESPVEEEILDPGYHVPTGGALELVVGFCALAALLETGRRRAERRGAATPTGPHSTLRRR